eukprot:gnl/TRDRNA2_/TRDRNA2_194559_c0_seq1.p1 gnl/TRDRNA2_/TRDRNA2_194559_c0~~gnl/TRDRNA2_/TRDRNA2_194559_c0_seq1.p1  ORF type:complete len:209 (+),score=30.76 gnl/TRDRNA2_/TRDRNA2_194559_c0_seq1:127-753(+)
MRSSQAILRLGGGLASALLVFAAIIGFFVDVCGSLLDGHFFSCLHFLADCVLLAGTGTASVLAEIRPNPLVTANAPYLSRLNGRALLYVFMGMYVIGRRRHGGESWLDFFVGMYTLCIAAAGLVVMWRLRSFPSTLTEAGLPQSGLPSREMHATMGPSVAVPHCGSSGGSSGGPVRAYEAPSLAHQEMSAKGSQSLPATDEEGSPSET